MEKGVRKREGRAPIGSTGSGPSQDSLFRAMGSLARNMTRIALYSSKILVVARWRLDYRGSKSRNEVVGKRLAKMVPLKSETGQSGEISRKDKEQDSEKDWVWEIRESKWVGSCRKRIQSEDPGQSPGQHQYLRVEKPRCPQNRLRRTNSRGKNPKERRQIVFHSVCHGVREAGAK